jgi:ubiquinone/menaquinone biosynthesis C-methylase UbiE
VNMATKPEPDLDPSVLPHNRRWAAMWSSGGIAYDEISRQMASALAHCVRRLDPQPDERILDLATGTGWTSRLEAECGATVTGVDIAQDLLAAAKETAEIHGHAITYELGDAEKLHFADGSFDAVSSTFGVMFVTRPEAAAAEITRVCRKGGRIAITAWTPESNIVGMYEVIKRYMPTAAASDTTPAWPYAWGTRERMQELFGDAFDLAFEEGDTIYYERDAETTWQAYLAGFGPVRVLMARLPDQTRQNFKRDFMDFHRKFHTPVGIRMSRQYLLTLGTRR